MAQTTSVTTPGMQQACTLFEGASDTSTKQMQHVNQLQLALQASWKGDASNKFSTAMNEWEDQFATVIKELNHMIEVMGGNAKAYEQNEAWAESIAPDWAMADGLPGL